MGETVEPLIEIPRSRTANAVKLGLGFVLIAFGAALMPEPQPRWQLSFVLWFIAALLIVNNARMLLRRPPVLRATRGGLWFGGGPVIAWHEVAGIYEGGIQIERSGPVTRAPAINVAFHRKRTVLRLPSSLWLTACSPGHVKISLYALDEIPNAVVTRLEALRAQAAGGSELRTLDAAAPPRARIVSRS